MQGWFKLHRQIIESPVFSDPDILRLWILCLSKATHKGVKVMIERKEVELLPGQFITGRFSLHEEYNKLLPPRKKIPDITLWRWMKTLEKCGNLNISSTNKYSVITVTKWHEYQEDEQQMNNKRTTDEQQMNTNKNVKNDNKKPSRPKSPKIYDDDSIPLRLANYLLKNIRGFKSDFKEPNLQVWADDMRKLMELDKREAKQIGEVIEWVTKDPFWQANILCAATLRKQWDKVTAKMAQGNKRFKDTEKKVINLPYTVDEKEAEWLAEQERKQRERNEAANNLRGNIRHLPQGAHTVQGLQA